MRKNILITLSLIALLLLVIRGLIVYGDRADREREWFLNNLRYEFSATVDSVGRPRNNSHHSFIYFSKTAGAFDQGQELRLDNRLLHRHMKFISRRDGYFFIALRDSGVQTGDSLVVSSSRKSIMAFRDGIKVAKFSLDDAAYGRPWR